MVLNIKTAERTEKRRFNKVFNNDLRKYLAEIIINSDDSYKRLISKHVIGEDSFCPIYINIDSNNRVLQVVDNAEGMDLEELKKNFGEYGADTSGGSPVNKVRGLFGQGATDVLLNASLHTKVAEIDSFKNGKFYTCKFKWNHEKQIYPQESRMNQAELRKIRNHYKIPNNGTIVHFGLPDEVKIQRKLEEEISDFYMLRFILNNPNRSVLLTIKGKCVEKMIKYEFPKQNEESCLVKTSIVYPFENMSIRGELTINKILDETSISRDLRILVFDDEFSVYDNTLFGYDKYPGGDNIHGYLKLYKTSEIIRAKLNQKQPEEILTDTRDGFQKNHIFYKSLSNVVEPHIISALQKINSEKKENEVSLTKQEWSDAFKEINKYFQNELEEEIGGVEKGTEPPSEGLRFVYPSIKITTGKKYTLKLLINLNKIPLNSKVVITYDGKNIEINPIEFIITDNDVIHGNLVAKSISIIGLIPSEEQLMLVASALDTYNAKLFITVIDKDIHYPKYGLEYWPNSTVVKINKESKGHLYLDTQKHPLGSELKLTASNANIELVDKLIVFNEQHLISENIGMVDCRFVGKVIDTKSQIKAEVGNASTELIVIVKDHDQPPIGSNGFLSGVKIMKSDMFWQTFYNPNDWKITINSGNTVNKLHLGNIDTENPKFTKEQNKYLAELCATESAKQLVRRKIDKGNILEKDFESVLDFIQKEKNKLFDIFIRNIEKFI